MTIQCIMTHDYEQWDDANKRLAGWDGPGWYFWDETGTYCHGPFDTKQGAESALSAYAWRLDSRL